MKKKPKHTVARLTWFDNHLIEIIAGFLLAFLPLYPKWPLFDALPGYIVRVRLEDFIVAIALTIFFVQVKRGKAALSKNPLFKPILLYLTIGLISSISAIFLTKTVPAEPLHLGKLFLHWGRRVEYMSLALIFFAAITSKKSLKRVLTIFIFTAIIISIYGLGQKYLQWPVYSTMNREFAKGWRLVLTEHARVSSTFAGHYDLAAYNVIFLPIVIALIVFSKSKLQKYSLSIAYLLTFATLLLTASRTSFIAYAASITVLFILFHKFIGTKKALGSWIIIVAISFVGFRFTDVYDRFDHAFGLNRIETMITDKIINPLKPDSTNTLDLPNNLSLVYSETDQPPTPAGNLSNNQNLPPDVYEAIPVNFPEASLSGVPATTGTGSEGQERTYSDNAFKHGLSSAIRFDALWPRAIQGFLTNPLLGSGYSTLLKENVTDFTEAESTDNDYLRALGETGLLGFLSFFGIFVYAIYKAFITLKKSTDPTKVAFLGAFIALLVGLLINALYIDIFEASKVAYTLWSMMGIAFSLVVASSNKKTHTKINK